MINAFSRSKEAKAVWETGKALLSQTFCISLSLCKPATQTFHENSLRAAAICGSCICKDCVYVSSTRRIISLRLRSSVTYTFVGGKKYFGLCPGLTSSALLHWQETASSVWLFTDTPRGNSSPLIFCCLIAVNCGSSSC